ncbi:hypothetical protein BDB00DRAFT_878418 [Zychaea mexicana]|uniref:uncharacterized protein n=1 Tax=Zychaea mexicana TaxID=64656 RepID=UPI0022FE3364|nr:uncharacterized protein BDB00DRAFT_878418 [Zychaea mexicana]KAI9484799.1 hypothetical protein BDB00DRAFT_878418 [Zychaea mexicana]
MSKAISILTLIVLALIAHIDAYVIVKPTPTVDPDIINAMAVLPTAAPLIRKRIVKRTNVQETLSLYQDWAKDCNSENDEDIDDTEVNENIRKLWQTVTVYCGNNHVKTVTKTRTATATATETVSSDDEDDEVACDDQCWSDYLWHTYGYGITVAQGFTGITCIIIGLYFMIFGYRYFRPTLGLVGFVFFALMTWVGLVNNEPFEGYPHTEIVYICVSIGLGLLGGILYMFFFPLGLYFVGALAGLFFAVYIMSWQESLVIQIQVARICFIIGMGVLFIILVVLVESFTIVFSTAFTGAYLFILGLDFFAHTGFINALLLIFDGNPNHYIAYIMNTPVIVMLAFVIVLTLLSAGWQYYWSIYKENRLFGVNVVKEKPPAEK